MTRRAMPQDVERISLFPFLAVLICTMGVLLVLLIVITQRTQAKAVEEHAAVAEETEREDKEKLEDIELWIEQWQGIHDATAEHLSDRRKEMAHIEEHMRRVRSRLKQLQTALKELEDASSTDQQQNQTEAELADLREKIAQAKAELAKAKLEAKTEVSYAVVPYDGPNQTKRRPIYLECRHDAVVLQPEGIRLTQKDFIRPLGPGNPLASALHAASQHLLLNSANPNNAGEPYPLLLVRPDGIRAYGEARKAIELWGADFGYELVGDDWDFEFTPPDPHLAKAVNEAIDASRRRRAQRQIFGSGNGNGNGQGGSRQGHQGESGDAYRGESTEDGGGGGGGGDFNGGRSSNGNGDNGNGDNGSFDPSGSDAGTRSGGLAGNSDGSSGQSKEWQHAGGAQPPRGSDQGGGQSQQGFASQQNNSSQPSPGFSSSRDFSSSGGGSPSGNPGSGSSSSGGSEGQSLADSRGKDWANPNKSKGLIPIVRTIRVEVKSDMIVIYPNDRRSQPTVVPIRDTTEEAVEEFVSEIWGLMKTWGSAGRQMYWRPAMNVYAIPGGEQRAQELEKLLSGSGLDVNLQGDLARP